MVKMSRTPTDLTFLDHVVKVHKKVFNITMNLDQVSHSYFPDSWTS